MSREATGHKVQGVDEKIIYTIDMASWGVSTPTSPSATVYDITGGTYDDVTSTVMPSGAATVNGSIVTLPLLQALELGHMYRVEVQVTGGGGQVFEPWFRVIAER